MLAEEVIKNETKRVNIYLTIIIFSKKKREITELYSIFFLECVCCKLIPFPQTKIGQLRPGRILIVEAPTAHKGSIFRGELVKWFPRHCHPKRRDRWDLFGPSH